MRRSVAALALAVTWGAWVACASAALAASDGDRVERLRLSLAALPAADPGEALRVATTAVHESERLAEAYGATRPALLHNLLVRLGLRRRGLCCHWARDLLDRIEELPLETLHASWGVARYGSLLREHSAVVIRTEGVAFEDGVVLDAWRSPGTLVFARVGDDAYPWRPHPEASGGARIHCR